MWLQCYVVVLLRKVEPSLSWWLLDEVGCDGVDVAAGRRRYQ